MSKHLDLSRGSSYIAIFIPSLRGGGAERVMVSLANDFAARGHRVDLVLVEAVGPYLSDVSADVRIIDLDAGRALFSYLPLVKYLRRNVPDVLMSALSHTNIIAILARMSANVGTRLIISERSTTLNGGNGWERRLVRRLMRRLYPRADGVIAVSNSLKTELEDRFRLNPKFVFAIGNPVDVEQNARLAELPVNHPWMSESVPVIVAVGRLVDQKDYPTLLKAFFLIRKVRAVRLVILGEGPLLDSLQRFCDVNGIADDVQFVGFMPNPFSWMARASVYVLSSKIEGFPNTLIQALSVGSKVVSTDCPTGPSEILALGTWGTLVPVGNPRALADAVIEAIDNETMLNVRDRSYDFSHERIGTLYLNILVP